MIKNIKKVLVSLGIAMLVTTSVGQAASFSVSNNYSNYNRYKVRYIYNYNYDYNDYYNNWFNQARPSYEEKVETPIETPVETPVETPNDNYEVPEAPQQKEDTTKTEANNNTGSNTNSSVEMEIVNLVNIERQKEGLAPLQYSSELSNVARMKSQDMAQKNYFSHNSPTYGDPFTMMKSFGIKYRTAGENIAKGYSSAQSVMNGWMNSSGHRANILNPSFGKIGVGYVNINGTTYWTQMFTD